MADERMEQREARRQLDAEIAERVFGAKWYPTPNDMNYGEAFWLQFPSEEFADMGAGWVLGYRYADNVTPDVIKSKLPHYSTDIAAAFQVVEAMRAKGWGVQIDDHGFLLEEWRVLFMQDTSDESRIVCSADAPTLPLAICQSALNTMQTIAQLAADTPAEAALQNSETPASPSSLGEQAWGLTRIAVQPTTTRSKTMSWSASFDTSATFRADSPTFASPQIDAILANPATARQYILARQAAKLLLSRPGVLPAAPSGDTTGADTDESFDFRVNLSGHANEDHRPAKGWANDAITVSVTQK